MIYCYWDANGQNLKVTNLVDEFLGLYDPESRPRSHIARVYSICDLVSL